MRVLLDTHAFLWWVFGQEQKLSGNQRQFFASSETLLLSVASVWEIAIKVKLGKLTINDSVYPFITEQLRVNQIVLLPIELTHVCQVSELSLHHRDPFDRLLIAQALVEDIPILSSDTLFDLYGVNRIGIP